LLTWFSSLQIGVAVPYLERDLKKLCEIGILHHRGGKYETALAIVTRVSPVE
jgi:hypothetical protein